MASVWDTESETVLPTTISLEVRQSSDTVTQKSLWAMLSQTMGFHYGDNVKLSGEGTYSAKVTVGPFAGQTIGTFDGRFETQRSAEMTFSFKPSETYDLKLQRLGEKAGKRGAVEPMMDQMPVGRAPPSSELPGETVGTIKSGDVEFIISQQKTNDESSPVTLVSPRTAYNGIIVPGMSLSMTVSRNDSGVTERELSEAIGPVSGFHYRVAGQELQQGDTVSISVAAPPQVARHDGYETAFFDLPTTTVSV
jgi:hypothetical protein